MFLLFGVKTVLNNRPGRSATCQHCGQLVHHHLQERATKFTVFFIPIFTTSRTYRISCSNCGQTSAVNSRQKKAVAW